jgi:hypothetical protein
VRYFPILFPPPLIASSCLPSLSTLPSEWPQRLLINACVCSACLYFVQFTNLRPPQLSKEYVAMRKEPPPFVWAAPDEKDILICASCFSHLMDRILIPLF